MNGVMMEISELLQDEQLKIGTKNISLLELFNIEEAELSENMSTQAALYAYIGVHKIRLERIRNDAKQEREKIYAKLDLAWRQAYELDRQKYTESMIKSCILTDQMYVEVQNAYNEAEENFLTFELLIKALEMRANMLQSVGAFLRMENQMTGMHTKEFEDQLIRIKGKLRSKHS